MRFLHTGNLTLVGHRPLLHLGRPILRDIGLHDGALARARFPSRL